MDILVGVLKYGVFRNDGTPLINLRDFLRDPRNLGLEDTLMNVIKQNYIIMFKKMIYYSNKLILFLDCSAGSQLFLHDRSIS